MPEAKQSFETTLSWLRSNLGSSHPIAVLYDAACNFVSNLLQQPFVPRLSTINQLENFVKSRNCGSVLVYAPAGFGKTTLVANWAFGAWDGAIAVHFFSRAPEFFGLASNPSIAFAHLLAQIFAIGEVQQIRQKFHTKFPLPEIQNERANLLHDTISNLKLPHGNRLLILLDGIDEADEPFPSPFPAQLPEGVFIIVSARWDGQSEMPYLRGWHFDAQMELGLMETHEIAEWLKCYGNGELKPLAEDSEFIAKLKRTTDGLPLFLKFVLDDLAEKVKRGEKVSEVEVPQGFSAYISEQVQRIVASSWDGIPLTDLVALLSIAKGAIRQDEIAQILNIPVETLAHLPNIIARWLRIGRIRPADSSTHSAEILSFSFAHPLLASEFAKAMGEKANETMAKLIAWCSKWREHKSEYALRYFDEHLYEVGEFEKLWELAMDDDWAKIHNEVFPNEPELPLKAVRSGLIAAIKNDDVVMMARMLLRHAGTLSKSESPLEALKRGKFERALKLAELLMEQDASVGIIWHLVLAWTWHQRGDNRNAREALKQLLRTWREEWIVVFQNLRSRLLEPLHNLPEALEAAKLALTRKENLARSWAARGAIKQALELARSIENHFNQSLALSTIATEVAKVREIKEAQKLFAEAKRQAMAERDELMRSHALLILLKTMWDAGLGMEAKQVAEDIVKFAKKTEASASVEILSELANLLLEQGDVERAESCLRLAKMRLSEIEDYCSRCSALSEIAKVLMSMGQEDELGETVRKILGEHAHACPYCCAESLCKIAEAALGVGQQSWAKELVHEATKIVAFIADETEQGWTLGRIAKLLVKLGLLEEAKSLARAGRDWWWRSNAWEEIVKGLIELGRREEAEGLIDNIEGIQQKSVALCELAKAMVQDGKDELARQVFERAKSLSLTVWDLMKIAANQMDCGLFHEGLATLEQALDFWRKERREERWSALRVIVEVLAEQGRLEDAEKVARTIKSAWQKARALWKVSLCLVKEGRKREAELALKQVAGLVEAMVGREACAVDRSEFFMDIFSDALKIGWQEAVDILISEIALKHPHLTDEVKEIAAQVAAKEGFMGKAAAIAQSIAKPENRAWALIAVSDALAMAGEKDQAKRFLEEAWQLSEQAQSSVACIRNEVVKRLAHLGEWEKALKRLDALKVSWYDWRDAVKFLSKEAVRQGKTGLAKQIAGKCRQVDLKAEVWTDLVKAFEEAGMKSEARKAFERAKKLAIKCMERDEAISYLAQVVAHLGWLEKAQQLIEMLDEEKREETIEEIVRGIVWVLGKPELAKIFAQQINSVSAWVDVGYGWTKVGDKQKAKVAFEKALSLAKGWGIELVAEGMVETGFADEGVKLIEGIQTSKQTLQNVLNELAKQGDRKNFLKLLPQCRWDAGLAFEACGLLAKLSPEQALEIANVILKA